MKVQENSLPRLIGISLVVVALTVGILPLAPHVALGDGGPELRHQVAKLKSVEDYISYRDANGNQIEGLDAISDGYRVQVLDVDGALAAGIDQDTVNLASEIVSYQNEIVSRSFISKTTGIPQDAVDLQDYPRVKTLYSMATEGKRHREEGQNDPVGSARIGPFTIGGAAVVFASDPHPCGNYDYPVPDSSPTRHYFTGDGETFFADAGYHQTAGYASGYNDSDYTRGRSYVGDYGTCSSPRFRDHGLVHSETSYSIQWGEPNPEVLSYLWPYWNWAAYVDWWHENY